MKSHHFLSAFSSTKTRRYVVGLFLFLFAAVAWSAAQEPPGPVQIISNSEFAQMVKDGQLMVAGPDAVLRQYLQRLLTYLKNREVVEEFMRQNPDLPGFAALVAATPSGPNVFPTIDGDFRTVITNTQGVSQVIETNGQGEKLAALAHSIQTSADPVQQLALYQSMYSHYTTLYNQLCTIPVGTADIGPSPGCKELTVPSAFTNPSALQTADLKTIQSALKSVASQGPTLIHIVPPSEIAVPLGCSAETGASVVADNVLFGDQTNSKPSCSTPSPNGILANFNWLDKDQLSCVRNQGARGLCHIFAATSALEELIARDTGNYVNLSEQDFTEHEKLIWVPDYFHDGGDAYQDLTNADKFGYQFAYENEWDYNPSFSQPQGAPPPAFPVDEFINSCNNYPSTEPGCSWSTPQANVYCTPNYSQCGFTPAVLPGSSPYTPHVVQSLWNPQDPYTSFNLILSFLAFNDAVMLGFNVTNAFQSAPGGYVPCCGFDLLSSQGGHVVHIVGFVSNSDLANNPGTQNAPPGAGGGYFIIKNSWGTCSGDAGYYYMPVTYLELETTDLTMLEEENH